MVAKPVTGHSVFSRALLAPGDVGIGTHTRRGAVTRRAQWRQSLWNTRSRTVGEVTRRSRSNPPKSRAE